MSLLSTLRNQLAILEQRKIMLPRYIHQEHLFVSRYRPTEADIDKLAKEIKEVKAAIWGIEKHRLYVDAPIIKDHPRYV